MIFGGVCKSGILPNGNFNRGHDDKASNLGVTLFRQVTNPYSISYISIVFSKAPHLMDISPCFPLDFGMTSLEIISMNQRKKSSEVVGGFIHGVHCSSLKMGWPYQFANQSLWTWEKHQQSSSTAGMPNLVYLNPQIFVAFFNSPSCVRNLSAAARSRSR